MSKRRRKSSKKFVKNHPRKVGKFYHARDSSGGHPARVYYSNPKDDEYYIQRFSTHDRKEREKLKHSIDPNSNNDQWLIRRPEAVGFDDMIHKYEYDNFRVHPDDEEIVIKYQKYDLKKNKKNR